MDVKGMREILFRGKRIDNAEWVDGYLYEHEPALVGIVSENDVPEPSKWFIARTGFADWNMPRPVEFVEVDPATVGQYTGLKDKAGKMIFEGDIVDASNEWWNSAGPAGHDSPVILVEWKNGLCGFEPFANYDCDCGVYINAKNCEVLGNIHDNPELLKDFNGGV